MICRTTRRWKMLSGQSSSYHQPQAQRARMFSETFVNPLEIISVGAQISCSFLFLFFLFLDLLPLAVTSQKLERAENDKGLMFENKKRPSSPLIKLKYPLAIPSSFSNLSLKISQKEKKVLELNTGSGALDPHVVEVNSNFSRYWDLY